MSLPPDSWGWALARLGGPWVAQRVCAIPQPPAGRPPSRASSSSTIFPGRFSTVIRPLSSTASPRRIVPSVFQALESLDQNWRGLARPHVSDDAAHQPATSSSTRPRRVHKRPRGRVVAGFRDQAHDGFRPRRPDVKPTARGRPFDAKAVAPVASSMGQLVRERRIGSLQRLAGEGHLLLDDPIRRQAGDPVRQRHGGLVRQELKQERRPHRRVPGVVQLGKNDASVPLAPRRPPPPASCARPR